MLRKVAFLWLTIVANALAQGHGSVAGTVYDSVARAPVANAVVQLVAAQNPAVVRSATSDDRGRFAIDSVLPGQYVIGFQHDALDSLALNSPLVAVDIRSGQRSRVDLAVPPPARIIAALCGVSAAKDSTGLILGLLRESRGQPLDTGIVQSMWQELTIDRTHLSSSQRSATATVTKEGWFALCGVPVGSDVALFGTHGSDSTGLVAVTIPVTGLVRRDLVVGGKATIHGSIVSERNRPITNARVQIAGRDLMTVTDTAGRFRLAGIPAGSQTIEVRAIGYAPELRALTLGADADTAIALTLTSVKRVLDTIHVVSQRVYNKDSNGFLRRKRMGFGYFFDQESVRRQRPFDLTRFLYQVPSMHEVRQGFQKIFLMRGGSGGGYCQPSFYLNGMKMSPELLGDLDMLATPEELEGMEIYRGAGTPAEFSNFNGCGSVVIWTRPPLRR